MKLEVIEKKEKIMEELVDITTFSTFFAKKKPHEIERLNLLSDMKKNVDESDILLLKGDEGSGKTVLLSQFCQKYNAISIFISPTKSASYTPEIVITDLIRQINFLLGKNLTKELPETTQKLTIVYNSLIGQLDFYAIRNGPVYIVIDGLYHLSEENVLFLNQLVDLIPFGKSNIKFIFSDLYKESLFSKQIAKIRYLKREQAISGLSSVEIKEIFEITNTSMTLEEAEEIRNTFNGNPMEVSELRYLMDKEKNDIQTTIDIIQKNSFDYIFSKLDSSSEILDILSLIIFSSKEMSVSDLSQIMEIDELEIVKIIENDYFLENEDFIVKLRNESYINKLLKVLSGRKKETYSKLAKFIVQKNNTNDYWLLAQYYEKAENYTELFILLDDIDFVNSVINSKSLSSFRMLVYSGLKASNKIDDIESIFKYSLANSILKNKNNNDKKIEIESLMLLNQEERALSIARACPVLEDKIHLLAIIARKQKDDRGVADPQITDEIRSLYEKIDFDYLGVSAIEIASELISIDVDLSVSLLEKSFDLEKDESSMDKIMLLLSFESFKDPERRSDSLAESIKQKMKTPELKDAFSTMFNFGQSIRPKYLLDEIEKIDSVNAKINFLANWCEENDGEQSRIEILKYAFDLLNSSVEYQSNSGIYYKLSNQLLFEDHRNYDEMLSLFESREELLQNKGATVLYVRLILNVIIVLDKMDKKKALQKIEYLYEYIESIDDISPKLESKSYFLVAVKNLINKDYYEDKLGIIQITQIELEKEITNIISKFAYQEELLAKSLEVLSNTDYDFCCDSIEKVNTVVNREQLYKSMIKGLTNQSIMEVKRGNISKESIIKILRIIRKVEFDIDIKDNGIEELLESLEFVSQNQEMEIQLERGLYSQINELIKGVRESAQKIRCFALMLNIFKNQEYLEKDSISDRILEILKSIDILPRRNRTGYELVKILAQNHLDIANKISQFILSDRFNNEQFEVDEFWTVIRTIKILISTFENVKYSEFELFSQQIDKIVSLIETIDSEGEKAVLFSQLYLSIEQVTTQQVTSNILKKITLCIDSISSDDLRYKSNVLRRCSPTLHKGYRSYLMSNFTIQTPMEIEELYNDLVIYYLTKTTLNEPFNFDSTAKYNCGYEDMLEALNLIKESKWDSVKYRLLRLLLEIIRDNRGNEITDERKADLKTSIKDIIENSFNSEDFIKHDGYKILSEYYCWLTFDSFDIEKVNIFVQRINEIPNKSDQALCLTTVASAFKNSKYSEKRDEILDKTEKIIEQLESVSEKILRYEDMAESIHGKNSEKEKKYIKKAFELIDDIEKDEKKIGKRLIDLAHQLDPEFANSLISSYKKDETDKSAATYKKHKKSLKEIEFNEKILNDRGSEDLTNLEYNQAMEICKICWKSLSHLKSQNRRPKKPEQILNYLHIASRLPIEESYPIYCWFIENVKQKKSVKNKNQYFEASYVATRFALINKTFQGTTLSEIQDFYNNESSMLSVVKGMYDEAIDFISSKLSNEKLEEIIISDPFFDKEDLKFLNSLNETLDIDNIEFKILTSENQLRQSQDRDYKTIFKDYWKNEISADNPPFIDIYVINDNKTNQSPFHDRHIITSDKGLILGGSINGLGKNKEINITEISEENRINREVYYTRYINNDTRYFRKNNFDLTINWFSL